MTTQRSNALVCTAALVALVAQGCGLDVTFEEDNRALLGAYEPDAGQADAMEDVADAAEDVGAPLESFDHLAWGQTLDQHLQGACVDYQGLGEDLETLDLLGRYADQLARLDPQAALSPTERAALWVNAYNALTVLGVVQERQEDPGFSVDQDGFVFFAVRRWDVGPWRLSLDLIEHGVLRGDTGHASMANLEDEDLKAALLEEHARIGGFDPRLHFALNCASRSCPDLAAEPFDAQRWEGQLEAQARRFLADPSKGAGAQGISMLFLWFEQDFVDDAGSVADFLEAHREGGLEGVDLGSYLDYSWSPNELQEGLAACAAGADE
jgi:hypothetical protein